MFTFTYIVKILGLKTSFKTVYNLSQPFKAVLMPLKTVQERVSERLSTKSID